MLSLLCRAFEACTECLSGVNAAWGLANLTLLVAGECSALPMGACAYVSWLSACEI